MENDEENIFSCFIVDITSETTNIMIQNKVSQICVITFLLMGVYSVSEKKSYMFLISFKVILNFLFIYLFCIRKHRIFSNKFVCIPNQNYI